MVRTAKAPPRPVLLDEETLRAFADPTRVRILGALVEPRTVKQVAEKLGVPPTRLYYHFKILERNGLIRVASTRLVSGIQESRYEAVTTNFGFADSVRASDLVSTGALAAILDASRQELEAGLLRDEAASAEFGASGGSTLGWTRLSLDADRLQEFRRRLIELIGEFVGDGDAAGFNYGMLVAMYPLSGADPQT